MYIYIYEILFPDGQIFQKFIFFFKPEGIAKLKNCISKPSMTEF